MRSPRSAGSRLPAVHRTTVLSMALLLCGLATAGAAEPLSESAFLAIAPPLAPLLEEEVAAERAAGLALRRLADPELSFEREEAGDELEESWRLRWTPPLDARRRPLLAAAEAAIAAAGQRARGLGLELRLEMRATFADWAMAHARRGILAEHAERLAALARDLEHQARLGEASGLEARRLVLAARVAESELARAEANEVRTAAVARAWRDDLESATRPILELPPLPPVAQAEPPEIAALEFELERHRRQLIASRRWWGAPSVELGWKTVEPGPFEDELDGAIIAIGWTVPLFDRRQDETIESEARLAAGETRLELARRQATARAEGTRQAYQRLLDSIERGAIITGHENLVVEGALAAYRLGESDATDLLSTLETVKNGRLERLELLAAAHAAHRALERAIGSPLPLVATGEGP